MAPDDGCRRVQTDSDRIAVAHDVARTTHLRPARRGLRPPVGRLIRPRPTTPGSCARTCSSIAKGRGAARHARRSGAVAGRSRPPRGRSGALARGSRCAGASGSRQRARAQLVATCRAWRGPRALRRPHRRSVDADRSLRRRRATVRRRLREHAHAGATPTGAPIEASWFAIVRAATPRHFAISTSDRPATTSKATSRSAAVSCSEKPGTAPGCVRYATRTPPIDSSAGVTGGHVGPRTPREYRT